LILFFPRCCFEPAILEEGVSDHRHERMTVKTLPGSPLEVVKTEFFFQLLMRLLANPSRFDGSCQRVEVRARRQVGEIVFLLTRGPSPINQASSPGRCCCPLSLIRCGGPSATRTRTAAKRALSLPSVPVRQLMVRHLAWINMSSAGLDRTSGMCHFRGRPRLATGQTICTSAGYTLRCRGIPTAQASLRTVSP
jgi:hypothetical protein